ncbi:MAG: DNA glycosylase AlkZ-like family protein [Acidimicrobiales bacterium]
MPRLWWALRHFAPLVHAPTGGPWAHGERAAYSTARSRPPGGYPATSVPRLVLRYLECFGPATAVDNAQFTFLRQPVVRATLDALAGSLEVLEGPSGTSWMTCPVARGPTRQPRRRLGCWGCGTSACSPTPTGAGCCPRDYRKLDLRRNGAVLPALLIDGHVAGVWRPVDGGIQATAFREAAGASVAGAGGRGPGPGGVPGRARPVRLSPLWHWWDDVPAPRCACSPANLTTST